MISIGLVSPKTKANVGSVLRAAGCYRAQSVAIERSRLGRHRDVATASTDTMKAYKTIPTMFVGDVFDGQPVGSVPVAIELTDDATNLVDFVHPRRAFYIFGPEDGTLGARHLERCARHLERCAHKVQIPTAACMNLAACVNVVLYDRLAKASALQPQGPSNV